MDHKEEEYSMEVQENISNKFSKSNTHCFFIKHYETSDDDNDDDEQNCFLNDVSTSVEVDYVKEESISMVKFKNYVVVDKLGLQRSLNIEENNKNINVVPSASSFNVIVTSEDDLCDTDVISKHGNYNLCDKQISEENSQKQYGELPINNQGLNLDEISSPGETKNEKVELSVNSADSKEDRTYAVDINTNLPIALKVMPQGEPSDLETVSEMSDMQPVDNNLEPTVVVEAAADFQRDMSGENCETLKSIIKRLQKTVSKELEEGKEKVPKGNHQCIICNKTFQHKRSMKDHVNVHKGEKPYSCPICKESFSRRTSLQQHRLVHSNVKLYHCNICEKAFSRKYDLKNHQFVHSGEQPFKCELCAKSFKRRYGLNRHMMLHTEGNSYSCDLCGRMFYRKPAFKKHLSRHIDSNVTEEEIVKESHEGHGISYETSFADG